MTQGQLLPYDDYPNQISLWKDKKLPLWYIGDPSILNGNMISIIGTRNPSQEGLRNAEEVAKVAASKGFCIVSGMAQGIDTAAHTTTLESSGKTIAVMGTPVEDCYPRSNLKLKEQIIQSGLVLSQFPPGKKTSRYNFPKRNELMAELSSICVVVEAGPKSGVRYQIQKAVQLKTKIVFFQNLVDQNYKWISQYLKYKNCFVFKSVSEFREWFILEGKEVNISMDIGEGADSGSGSSGYPDAIGYLDELKNKINKKWFGSMCEMALRLYQNKLDKSKLERLTRELLEGGMSVSDDIRRDYTYNREITSETQRSLFDLKLSYIGEFENFKGLGRGIEIKFQTPITIIFGANGSGKSSLCQAIKQLSGDNNDSMIIPNVMKPSEVMTNFKYRFSEDDEVQEYDPCNSSHKKINQEKIKYFDSDIAKNILTKNHDSKKIVSVEAFRLEVFEIVQSYLSQFEQHLRQSIDDNKREFSQITHKLKSSFNENNIPTMSIYDDIEQGDFSRFTDLMIEPRDGYKNISKRIDGLDSQIARHS